MFTYIQRFEWRVSSLCTLPYRDTAISVTITITLAGGRSCESDTHRFTGQTYDRSAFSDVGNAFLLRQCSITVHEVSTDRQ